MPDLEPEQVAICGLFYGPHEDLHARLIDSWRSHVPAWARFYIQCNQTPPATETAAQRLPFDFLGCSHENPGKYHTMRKLFDSLQPRVKWVVWFDDDSHIVAPDWFKKTTKFISAAEDRGEDICYVGQPWWVHYLPGQWDFVKSSPWFTGMSPEIIRRSPGVWFAQGAYWWLRADVLRRLAWPDKRLNHNGGDTLLGEAIRQQGLPFHRYSYGVKVNDAKRRGFRERPAGSTVEVLR